MKTEAQIRAQIREVEDLWIEFPEPEVRRGLWTRLNTLKWVLEDDEEEKAK